MAASRAPSPALGWILAHRSLVRTGPLAMVRKRRLDGMLVTMRSSGSHYLQWMLCMTMCEGLGLDHPEHLNDPSLIGFMSSTPTASPSTTSTRVRRSAVLRDPADRFVSGFYSLRQGAPAHHMWTPREAEAFEHFPTARRLARAIDPRTPKSRNAPATPCAPSNT